MWMPRRLASSIMVTATSVEKFLESTSPASRRLRSRFVPSSTSKTASGGDAFRPDGAVEPSSTPRHIEDSD